MPTAPTFARVSLDEFAQLLQRFLFTRRINAVHMHHTWRPTRADFNGHATIVAMWRHHTQTNGWRDIAQHITIDPEGAIWLGRNWNLPPASASGHNGNDAFGPFMFEMVGDFDVGRDPFDGEQRRTAIEVVALVQSRFDLPLESLRFHNMMSSKSCPGTSIDIDAVLAEVSEARGRLPRAAALAREAARVPFPDEPALALAQLMRALQRETERVLEPADAEPDHADFPAAVDRAQPSSAAAAARGLDAAALNALRPHLVNLTMGRLSGHGEATTTPADVDAIFEQHLPAFVARARAENRAPPVLFFAHGGLVSESRGLAIAQGHVDWWLRNGVYPIYLVWETGFFETIAQLLQRARGRTRAMARDLFDFTTDPLIELGARALQGPRIWGGMKSSAERAAEAPAGSDATGGGAHHVARALKAFCDRHGADVSLHAVGHSAGSILHAHFVAAAHALGVPAFETMQLLAPAIRCDLFKDKVGPLVGEDGAVRSLALYTMRRDFERDDDCAGIYRKSLLYLIHHALEDERSTPILGLEESLRADAALKAFFGLGGERGAPAEVVWSPSPSDSGRSASRSRTHGGFDDDAATMNSVARRILGRADADPIVEYPAARAGAARSWFDEVDWPVEFEVPALPPPAPAPTYASVPSPSAPAAPFVITTAGGSPSGGSRRALCVGIDAYPRAEHRLAGCVNDARRWEQALRGLGFETLPLHDGKATRSAIEQGLRELIGASRAGDVIVFQYAGHGTQVPDFDGDEPGGSDQALCPVDFDSGALLIDDDVAAIFGSLGAGVNLSCFMDCCHSGTNTRFAVGASRQPLPPDAKPRYIVAGIDVIEAHRRFRARLGASRSGGSGGSEQMRDVKFSACLDHEVAWESGGSGEFTLRALQVIGGGIDGFTNEQFAQHVVAAFGSSARQTPGIDCTYSAKSLRLLQPLHSAAAPNFAAAPGAIAGRAGTGSVNAQALHLLAQAMQALTAR